ncbi:MAG TPA: glycosyltransferase family 4 protein [Terriglobales bacterium]|nr:glycosyltransferase family 4 protein [Terriglobales bacterium]
MNVCMLAYAHYTNDARIKSYVRTLHDRGHRVDVVALKAEGEEAIEVQSCGTTFRIMNKYQGQSAIMYVWSYLKFFFKSSFLLTRRSLRRRYDAVHVHNMPNALVFAAAVPKMFGARLILDIHDLMTVNYMAKFDARVTDLPVRCLRAEQWLSAMFVDNVFCADHNQRDYLVQHHLVPEQKITVLMNLPNAELFGPVSTDKQSNGAFRIVYHGTIAHRLGIDLILRAMAMVVDRIPAELWIYGAGDYLPEALDLTSQLQLGGKVHFSRTFFPVEQISEIVSGMDLGIIGNRRNLACDKYMLPVKLLEYVYLGVPVVAPRLNVITRYFDDTMVRFYEPENVEQMANAIVELFHDRQGRERLARAASTFYHKHNIQAQVTRYLDLVTSSSFSLRAGAERSA